MSVNQLNQFDLTTLAFVADYFKVFSESSRLNIVHCLQSGPMNVMELTAVTSLGQANLSKHLKVLTHARILSRQTKGTSAYYEIIDSIVFDFCELACHRIADRLQQKAESFRNLQTAELNPTAKKE